jgi:AcrR family transcriptional regulator
MNGHEKRKLKKMEEIKNAAWVLCNQYGIQKISMDEISAKANVSKATVYKYFDSKEALIDEIIADFYDKAIHETKKLMDSDGDFLEKLNKIMMTKIASFSMMNGDFLEALFSVNISPAFVRYNERLREMMFEFFNQGKVQGYIDSHIDNEALYLYSEIFSAGLKKIFEDGGIQANDQAQMAQLVHLYFHGLVEK